MHLPQACPRGQPPDVPGRILSDQECAAFLE
jgi:hypothetical protein